MSKDLNERLVDLENRADKTDKNFEVLTERSKILENKIVKIYKDLNERLVDLEYKIDYVDTIVSQLIEDTEKIKEILKQHKLFIQAMGKKMKENSK